MSNQIQIKIVADSDIENPTTYMDGQKIREKLSTWNGSVSLDETMNTLFGG